MAAPFFSVIVPLYNKRDFIRGVVESIIAQSFRDFELIVVDDGSTDSSVAALEGIEDPRLAIHRKANGGVGSARNAGIAAARGDWIAFQDADDYWHVDHLRVLADAIAADGDVDLWSTFTEPWRGQDLTAPLDNNPVSHETDFFRALREDSRTFHLRACAFSRELVERIGGFTGHRLGEDIEFMARASLAGRQGVIEAATAFYNPNETSVTQTTKGDSRPSKVRSRNEFTPVVALLEDRLSEVTADRRAEIERFIDWRISSGILFAIRQRNWPRAVSLFRLLRDKSYPLRRIISKRASKSSAAA